MSPTEENKKRFEFKGLKSFSVFDLVLLAMLAGLSVAFKTVVGILVRMITGPLGIPGGALAGGFYMLWLPLAITLTGMRGSALLIAAVQTVVMVTTGAPGSHGVWTVLTYMLPAVLVELVYVYRPKNGYNILHYILSTILANMAGTFGSNLLFFRMSLYPLLFTLLAAAVSGSLGGVLAYLIYKGVEKSGVLKKLKKKKKGQAPVITDGDGESLENISDTAELPFGGENIAEENRGEAPETLGLSDGEVEANENEKEN